MAGTLVGQMANDPMNHVAHSVVTVGTTSQLIVPANEKRRSLILINDSNATIYISYDVPAQMNFGIRIEKDGGTWIMPSCCQFAVYAISATNNKKLLVNEGT